MVTVKKSKHVDEIAERLKNLPLGEWARIVVFIQPGMSMTEIIEKLQRLDGPTAVFDRADSVKESPGLVRLQFVNKDWLVEQKN